MREFELYDGYLTAPDEVVFAYNPCFLHLRDISEERVTVIVTDASMGGDEHQVARILLQTHDGCADVDIAAYLRSEFAGLVKRTDTFKTSTVLKVSIDTVSFDMTVIYGAMLPGEVFNPSRTVKMWSAYPQVVSFFSYGGDTVYIQKDGEEPQGFINEGYLGSIGQYDNSSESIPMIESGQIVVLPANEELTSTFILQFDRTFTSIVGDTIINIEIDNRPQCDDHIFLRWLDKWGMWQHWLCKVGAVEVSDAVVGEALIFLTGTTYPYYATRNIGKSMVRQITACATQLTEEEWKLLCTIKGSINICAYDIASQSWVPVNVSASTSAWEKGNHAGYRQDFPLKVVFPTIQTQTL